MKNIRIVSTALIAAAALAVLAGCSTGGSASTPSASSSTGAKALIPITVAEFTQNVANGALELGVAKGLFKDQGLDVKLIGATPNVIVSTVSSGAAQFGWTSSNAVYLAQQSGVQVKSVADYTVSGTDAARFPYQLVVLKSSPIKSVSQLDGKNMGTDLIGQWPQLLTTTSLKDAGVDTSSMKLTEVPQPNMLDALQKGTVDAALLNEPSLSNALQNGGRVLSSVPSDKRLQNMPLASFVASNSYITSHKSIVKKFQAAVAASNAYSNAHQSELRTLLPKITTLTADQAKVIRLYTWSSKTVNTAGWKTWATLLKQGGLLKTDLSVDQVTYAG